LEQDVRAQRGKELTEKPEAIASGFFGGSPCWAKGIFSHAYSRKYSRFARLRLLGFKTPYFRNLPSKNNT
jgi:hypothetical protein